MPSEASASESAATTLANALGPKPRPPCSFVRDEEAEQTCLRERVDRLARERALAIMLARGGGGDALGDLAGLGDGGVHIHCLLPSSVNWKARPRYATAARSRNAGLLG
jgi:hypothetical protein